MDERMMSECGFCAGPVQSMYSWTCPGCRARMLSALPSKQARQGWINRWRDRGEEAMVTAVIAKLREMADAKTLHG